MPLRFPCLLRVGLPLALCLAATLVPWMGREGGRVLMAAVQAPGARQESAPPGGEGAASEALHDAARDAAEGGAQGAEEEEGHAAEFDIVHHLGDAHYLDFEPFGRIELPRFEVLGIDMSITRHVVFLWLAAALMLAIFLPMARKGSRVQRGLYNFMEAIVVYVRDEVAVANIGKHAAPYVPYLLTLFFFILFANLLGLLPFGATATSNWIVTGALALLTMLVAEGSSVVKLGPAGYARQFVPIQLESRSLVGTLGNLLLAALLFVIEIVSHISRIVALMIRLAANMTAGHVIILALIGLIFLLRTYLVAPVSIGFAVGVYLLEIFIALIQAFIFTMLTALFIGMALEPHH